MLDMLPSWSEPPLAVDVPGGGVPPPPDRATSRPRSDDDDEGC